jgi:hypothetical protein
MRRGAAGARQQAFSALSGEQGYRWIRLFWLIYLEMFSMISGGRE